MKKYVLVLIALFSFYANASTTEKARELMKVMKIEEQINAQFEGSFPMIDELKNTVELTDEDITQLSKIISDWVNNDIDMNKIVAKAESFYAQNFSEKELDELIDFYKSPVGQKLVNNMPMLTNELARVSIIEAQNHQSKLMIRLQSFLSSKM